MIGAIGIKWIGWDGSVWDLRTGRVRLAKGGVAGLNTLDADVFVRETALVHGQRYTGWRGKARTVLLPVLIGPAKDALEQAALDEAWWNTMQPNKFGRLVVTAPNGTERYLDARFVDDGDMTFDHDPTIDGLSTTVIELVADDPWWKGVPFTKSFEAGKDSVDFFNGEAKGPPFRISPSATLGDTTIANPGKVDAWPFLWIDGPATEFTTIIDGAAVSASTELTAVEQLQIDTAPDKQMAWKVVGGTLDANGVRVGGIRTRAIRLLANVQFRPIPAGAEARLTVSINGTGRIRLSGAPRYFRAWG